MRAVRRFIFKLPKAGQWLRLILVRLIYKNRESYPVLATSMDLADDPVVARILPDKPLFHSRFIKPNASGFVGWGRKWSGRRAAELARVHSTSCLLLEDGFLRSVQRNDPPVSVLVDDLGVYYDANAPSRLEAMIKEPLSLSGKTRAQEVIAMWRAARLSKYNTAPEYQPALPAQYVLAVDQVRGDLSIRYGQADTASFEKMLKTALDENPDMDVVVKLHPDVFSNAAKAHFDPKRLAQTKRIHVIAENCHPVRLIENAEKIYAVTSQVGFEALIWGKKVRTFGMPFYAGWGLTEDELAAPSRRATATLEQLVHAALVRYPHYVDPITMDLCEVECAIKHIALQKRS